jgi:uncharacterized protein (DUF1330 family)
MAAYWMTNVEVTDPVVYSEYAKRARAAIEAHGGRFLARGGKHVQVEGRDRARNVIVEFSTLDDALNCYNSPEYQEALSFANRSSERDLVIVDGV